MDAYYVAANQFYVEGDQTDYFIVGRKVKMIISSSPVIATVQSALYPYNVTKTLVTIEESTCAPGLTSVSWGVPYYPGNLTRHASSHYGSGDDTIPEATTSSNGLMSASDKTKLDSMSPNQIKVSSDDTNADYLLNKIVAGHGLSTTETNPGGDEDLTLNAEVESDGGLEFGVNDRLQVKIKTGEGIGKDSAGIYVIDSEIDHGNLAGLADDDHTQYLTEGRHDTVTRHPPTVGGTGQSTYNQGDMLYSDAADSLARLGIGSVGQIIGRSGNVPAWLTPTAYGIASRAVQNFPNGIGTWSDSTTWNLYVSVNGSDTTGDGTKTSPYATLTKAWSMIPDIVPQGTTINIYLAAGTYTSQEGSTGCHAVLEGKVNLGTINIIGVLGNSSTADGSFGSEADGLDNPHTSDTSGTFSNGTGTNPCYYNASSSSFVSSNDQYNNYIARQIIGSDESYRIIEDTIDGTPDQLVCVGRWPVTGTGDCKVYEWNTVIDVSSFSGTGIKIYNVNNVQVQRICIYSTATSGYLGSVYYAVQSGFINCYFSGGKGGIWSESTVFNHTANQIKDWNLGTGIYYTAGAVAVFSGYNYVDGGGVGKYGIYTANGSMCYSNNDKVTDCGTYNLYASYNSNLISVNGRGPVASGGTYATYATYGSGIRRVGDGYAGTHGASTTTYSWNIT